eukprot:scaffold99905_cov32-Tisochrysis_lutea.AAC.2
MQHLTAMRDESQAHQKLNVRAASSEDQPQKRRRKRDGCELPRLHPHGEGEAIALSPTLTPLSASPPMPLSSVSGGAAHVQCALRSALRIATT